MTGLGMSGDIAWEAEAADIGKNQGTRVSPTSCQAGQPSDWRGITKTHGSRSSPVYPSYTSGSDHSVTSISPAHFPPLLPQTTHIQAMTAPLRDARQATGDIDGRLDPPAS